ncbi:U32 family peptidase, partial [Escherichia coli]|nr:U32 family peptidase [Escherichia coli]
GMQIILSTLALLQVPSELKEISKLVDNGVFLVEVYDFGVVNMLIARHLPFVAVPGLYFYNAQTLNILLRQGTVYY